MKHRPNLESIVWLEHADRSLCSFHVRMSLNSIFDAVEGIMAVQGHPRSLILAPIKARLSASCVFSLLPSGPQRCGKWVVSLLAIRRKPDVADWGVGMSASCKPRVQLFADKSRCLVYLVIVKVSVRLYVCHARTRVLSKRRKAA